MQDYLEEIAADCGAQLEAYLQPSDAARGLAQDAACGAAAASPVSVGPWRSPGGRSYAPDAAGQLLLTNDSFKNASSSAAPQEADALEGAAPQEVAEAAVGAGEDYGVDIDLSDVELEPGDETGSDAPFELDLDLSLPPLPDFPEPDGDAEPFNADDYFDDLAI